MAKASYKTFCEYVPDKPNGNEMHSEEIKKIRLALDALALIRPVKSKKTILDYQELLDRHLQGKVKKPFLKALLAELIFSSRETMPSNEFLQFKEMLGLTLSEPVELIEKIIKKGKISSDTEYRKLMTSIDILIQRQFDMGANIVGLISQANQLLAQFEGSKK